MQFESQNSEARDPLLINLSEVLSFMTFYHPSMKHRDTSKDTTTRNAENRMRKYGSMRKSLVKKF